MESLQKSMELYEQGRKALWAGDKRLAIEKFKESYRVGPHFKTFELLGETLMSEGEYIDAIIYLAAAAALGEKQFRSRFLLAKALLALGEVWKEDAIDQLKKCIELNPNYRTAKQLLQELSGSGGK